MREQVLSDQTDRGGAGLDKRADRQGGPKVDVFHAERLLPVSAYSLPAAISRRDVTT